MRLSPVLATALALAGGGVGARPLTLKRGVNRPGPALAHRPDPDLRLAPETRRTPGLPCGN